MRNMKIIYIFFANYLKFKYSKQFDLNRQFKNFIKIAMFTEGKQANLLKQMNDFETSEDLKTFIYYF